ncbi:putative interferon-induced protein with tetratricopeptide repeats 5-like [Apostichopus japonicus]|uniref:Putative interferon-induced protein with tetratricopeptide repeats 5-like n=1 Tax=Stichopus japonicus TaxID=307972 RepID=A0A2G8JBW1_STIJA|nr:putative interferon-induced protein with tetratricopeptide repeats 5-like [Apostichopus japonicus]
MGDPNWWKDNPCPLHPGWGLQDISHLDHAKLKLTIDTDDNVKEVMVVETLIYRAFLAYPKGKGMLYNQTRNNSSEALEFLQQAEDKVVSLFRNCQNAKIGYGIVINTFRMWIIADASQLKEFQAKLEALEKDKTHFPKHKAYIDVVRAYILSRFGPRWREEALSLYQDAIKEFPRNYQWLFGKALMVGREARHQRVVVGWGCRLPRDIRSIFKEEETLLKNVLRINPRFNLARAFYGQVLHNLERCPRRAAEEIKEALNGDSENRTICILAAKFYRVKGPFSKAETMLRELVRRVNIAEVHCQLGCLYRSKAYHTNDAVSFRKTALHHFEKATDLDNCHYPSRLGSAQMNAMLGNKEIARNLYMDLFENEYKDKPHHVSNEFKALESALESEAFDPPDSTKFLHRLIELAVVLTDNADSVLQVPFRSLDHTIDKCLRKLETLSFHHRDVDIRQDARLKFANSNLMLQRLDVALKLYNNLYEDYKANGKVRPADVIFGFGKCYFIKGNKVKADGNNELAETLWKKVFLFADELTEIGDQNIEFGPSDELYADVHLAKAKASSSSLGLTSDTPNLEPGSETWQHLKLAIQRGSLEACYIYISYLQVLKEYFFKADCNIPKTLAEIQVVCEVEVPLHTNFTVTCQNGSKVSSDIIAKKDFIQTAINEVMGYGIIITPDSVGESISSITEQIIELRENRLKYELELLRSKKSNTWETAYKKALSDVIRVARNMLDNCISVCQVRTKLHGYTEVNYIGTGSNGSVPFTFDHGITRLWQVQAKAQH